MAVYRSNISTNQIDLKQAQYKDIDKRYFDQLIQLKVMYDFDASLCAHSPMKCVMIVQFLTDNWDGK